jgi:hypothetical protein
MKYKIKLRNYIGGFDIENYKTYYVGMHGEIDNNFNNFEKTPIKIPDNCVIVMPFCCGYESIVNDSLIFDNNDLNEIKNVILKGKKQFTFNNRLHNIYYPGDYICDISFIYEQDDILFNTFINRWEENDIIAMNVDKLIISESLNDRYLKKNINDPKNMRYRNIFKLVDNETELYKFLYTIIFFSHFIDFNKYDEKELFNELNIIKKQNINEDYNKGKISNNLKYFCSKFKRNYDSEDEYDNIVDLYDEINKLNNDVIKYTKLFLRTIYMNFIDETYQYYNSLGFSDINIDKFSTILKIQGKKIIYIDSCQNIGTSKFCIKTLCMYLFNNGNYNIIDKYINDVKNRKIDKIFNTINSNKIEIELNDILPDIDVENNDELVNDLLKIYDNSKIIKNFIKIMKNYIPYLNMNIESMTDNKARTKKFIFNILILANYDKSNIMEELKKMSKLKEEEIVGVIKNMKELWKI